MGAKSDHFCLCVFPLICWWNIEYLYRQSIYWQIWKNIDIDIDKAILKNRATKLCEFFINTIWKWKNWKIFGVPSLGKKWWNFLVGKCWRRTKSWSKRENSGRIWHLYFAFDAYGLYLYFEFSVVPTDPSFNDLSRQPSMAVQPRPLRWIHLKICKWKF